MKSLTGKLKGVVALVLCSVILVGSGVVAEAGPASAKEEFAVIDGIPYLYQKWVEEDPQAKRLFYGLVVEASGYTLEYDGEAQVLGDVDGNNFINSSDALAVLKHASGNVKIKSYRLEVADVNYNGVVNAQDAQYILQIASGSKKAPVLYKEYCPYEYTIWFSSRDEMGKQ